MIETFEFQVRRADDQTDLLSFVARKLSLSRNKAKAVLDRRHVTVNGTAVWMARHTLQTGDRICVLKDTQPVRDGQRPVPILYRDDRLLVVSKPSGIVSCGARSLESRLQHELQWPGLRAVHRLDRDTSGCLICALDEGARAQLISAFRAKAVTKVYHAIVHGHMRRGSQRISKPLGGQTAVSNVRVLDASASASHVAVSIETGRTHQIRIHLAAIRHPVMGDRKYAAGAQITDRQTEIPRQMLHAQSIRFRHPFKDGETVQARSPLPSDFQFCLKRFKLT